MAMQKQLWSLNALAVELNRDRRTVARALDNVPADGLLLGNRAWHLQTALKALGIGDPAPSAVRGNGGLVENIRHRLSAWRSIYADPPPAMPIAAVSEILGVPVATLLIWLRAGCPYLAPAGCWKTGAGFMLHFAWVVEWRASIGGMVERTDVDLARQLGLTF